MQESELNWQNKVTSSSPFTPLNSIVSSPHYMMRTDVSEMAVEFVFDREGNGFGRGWLLAVRARSDGYGRKAVGFVERGCGRSCWCSCGSFEDGGWGISGISAYGERSVLMSGRRCWFLKERNARVWEVN